MKQFSASQEHPHCNCTLVKDYLQWEATQLILRNSTADDDNIDILPLNRCDKPWYALASFTNCLWVRIAGLHFVPPSQQKRARSYMPVHPVFKFLQEARNHIFVLVRDMSELEPRGFAKTLEINQKAKYLLSWLYPRFPSN
jgi:hypothetical protein